jgi:DNA-directed RNA polymerase specialized sigma subunit
MTAKEYLQQIKPIQIRIDSLIQQRDYLKSKAEYCGIIYTDMPHSVTKNIHRIEDTIINLIEWTDKIAEQYKKLNEINQAISEVTDSTAQAILVKKYVCEKTWSEISKELYICRSRLFELHSAALTEIEKSGRLVPIMDD